MLFELTKCFALLSKKQDGTFLKMWCEEGTFRFHMSNNNNFRQSTFRQSSSNQHIMSTPDPRSSTLSTPDPKPNYGIKLRENEDEEQPRKDEEEEETKQREDEQLEGVQTEDGQLEEEQQECDKIQEGNDSDKSRVNVNQYGYPERGHFKQAIFSYCKDVNIIQYHYRGPLIYQVPSCCSLCKIHANNSLKYVCVKHSDSAWHEWTTDCEKINPTYDLTYLEPI